jgi:uncharacterized repeat protein (TIGR03847 family)
MSGSYDMAGVERLTVGTVGPAGQRLFMLQARQGTELLTLKIEKAQVAALCEYLGELLKELDRPGHLPEGLDLEEPAEPEWVVGALGITYDQLSDSVVIVAEEAVLEDEVGSVARLTATREQAAALAIRGTSLVEAGRPPCPLCGYPLDPGGHACPRTNGFQPPTL